MREVVDDRYVVLEVVGEVYWGRCWVWIEVMW